MTARKPTLAERVQSLEDWFAEANRQAAQMEAPSAEPEDPEAIRLRESRAQLMAMTDAQLLILRDRITRLLEAELDKATPSTLRIRNLANAINELERF